MSPEINMSFAAPAAATAVSTRFAAFANPLTDFADGSAVLEPKARENLEAQAVWLTGHPDVDVRLIAGAGFGDRGLAAARARAIHAFLIEHGIDEARIGLSIAGEVATDGEMKMERSVLTQISVPREHRSSLATMIDFVKPAPRPIFDAPKETPDTTLAVVTPPVDDTPVDDTPVDDTPVDDTPVDDTPVDDTPVDDTPVGNLPQIDPPLDDTPVTNPPSEEKPKGNEKPKRLNAGGGNGGEGGDPGRSQDHNRAGDD